MKKTLIAFYKGTARSYTILGENNIPIMANAAKIRNMYAPTTIAADRKSLIEWLDKRGVRTLKLKVTCECEV